MDILSGLLQQRFTASARLILIISPLMSRVAHFDLVPGLIQVKICVWMEVISHLVRKQFQGICVYEQFPEIRLDKSRLAHFD